MNGDQVKHRLASALWAHVAAMDESVWKCRPSAPREVPAIHVIRGPLGKPRLIVGECYGPAISFSEGGGAVWAALSGDESDIGIDVAAPEEFQGGYPLQRVFDAQELNDAVTLQRGNVEKASALLWSIKEAAVKALGCGFHLVEPRDIRVHPSVEGDDDHTFSVCLSRKAVERLPLGASRFIGGRSLAMANAWLSIAFVHR